MHVAFPKDTFDKLVTYLGNKPFHEVEDLINELKATVKPINIVIPEPPKEGGNENVQSTETESTQSETTDEGGEQNQSEEPQNNNQG